MTKKLDSEQKKQVRKLLVNLLEELRSGTVFVEGKKDLAALTGLGCSDVLTISGNLEYSCKIVKDNGVKRVFVLTDLDERGNELAQEAREELERYGIKANLETRIRLGRLLGLREFESAHRKFEEIWDEVKE